MILGIVSDSHDQVGKIFQAVKVFNDRKADLVIHLGDLVSPFTLKCYETLRCPIKALMGNNQGDILRHFEFAKENGIAIEFFDQIYTIESEGHHIICYHGDAENILSALLKDDDYDVVLSGHDHVAKIEQINSKLHINPGTLISDFNLVMKNSNNYASVAIYNTKNNQAEIIKLT